MFTVRILILSLTDTASQGRWCQGPEEKFGLPGIHPGRVKKGLHGKDWFDKLDAHIHLSYRRH
jgi:hypothetical protein